MINSSVANRDRPGYPYPIDLLVLVHPRRVHPWLHWCIAEPFPHQKDDATGHVRSAPGACPSAPESATVTVASSSACPALPRVPPLQGREPSLRLCHPRTVRNGQPSRARPSRSAVAVTNAFPPAPRPCMATHLVQTDFRGHSYSDAPPTSAGTLTA